MHRSLLIFIVYVFTITLFLPLKFNSIGIFVLGFGGLFNAILERPKLKIRSLKINPEMGLLILYYLLILISLFWTTNMKTGLFEIEKKLAFIVFPIISVLYMKKTELLLNTFFKALKFCSLIIALFLIALSFLGYIEFGQTPYYHVLAETVGFNAIYLSCLLTISLLHSSFYLKPKSGFRAILAMTPVVIVLFLLSSKLFIGVIFLRLVWMSFTLFTKNKWSWRFGTLMLIFLLIFSPPIRNRLSEVNLKNLTIVNQSNFQYDAKLDGLNFRMILLKFGWESSKTTESILFGAGIGDVQDRLNAAYKTHGLYLGNPILNDSGYWNYNYHNQYMQIYCQFGLVGLILLLTVLFSALLKTYILNNTSLWAICLVFTLWFFTESALETQRGIVLFSFLYSLVFAQNPRFYRDAPEIKEL